ncbi:MAG: MOSC domain-containing protein [Gemmatimonadaceae bacterium]|nr:MOSC domain-containing protein [Acetobacteraceae bacterium]
MRSESLDIAELHWTWLHGDRQFAFVKARDTTDFPWLTARDLPRLVLFAARYAASGDPTRSTPTVTDPDGIDFDVRDPALARRLAEELGGPVWLLRLGRGAFDAMPVSLVTTTAVEAVGRAHGAPVALARFRSNIVIRPDDPAVTEQDWLGSSLAFGAGANPPRLHLDWAIPRCAIVGIDPGSATRDAGLLRTLVRRFGNAFGCYAAIQAPGQVRIGDRVRLVR